MKRVILSILVIVSFLFGTTAQTVAQALDYHWIGQGDAENWNDVDNWKVRASGSNDAFSYPAPSAPTEIDNVIFDDESFLITESIQINVTDAKCATMDWRSAINNPTFGGTGTLSIYGSLYLIDQMQLTFGGTILFKSTSADNRIIQSGNKLIRSSIEFDGDGSWTIDGTLSVLEDVNIKKGNVILGDQTIRLNKSWIVEAAGSFTSGPTGTVIFEGPTDSRIEIKNSVSEFTNVIIDKTVTADAVPSVMNFSEVKIKNNLTIEKGELKDGGFQINSSSYINTGTIWVKDGAILSLGDGTTNNGFTTFPSFNNRTLAANSTVDYRDRAAGQTILNTSYGNLKLSNGAMNGSPQTTKLLTGATTVNGNLTVATDINFIDNGYQLTGNNTPGKTLKLEGNATFTLGSNTVGTTLPSFNTYDLSSTSTVNYNAGVNQTIRDLTGNGYGNLTLTNPVSPNPLNRTKTLGNFDVPNPVNIRGNLTIGANNILDVSSNNNDNPVNQIRSINIQGNWSGLGSFIARTGTVVFNGTNNQDITTVTPNNEFFNVVINKPSGDIILNSDVSIGEVLSNNNPANNGNITFTKGLVRRPSNSAHALIINNNTTASGASQNSYVVGAVKKKGDDAFSFPVGNEPTATQPNSYYRPLAVETNNNVNTEYLVQYYNTPAPQNVPPAVSTTIDDLNRSRNITKVRSTANGQLQGLNGAVSRYEYWTLDNILDVNGSRNTKVSIPFNTATSGPPGYLGNPAYLVLAGWTRDNYWENRGGANQKGTPNQVSGDGTSGRIFGSEALSARMNVFTVGTIFNALPIELLYFNASLVNKEVQFSWATAKEVNNDYFTIEKSSDGIHFDALLKVDGAGNSQEIRKYTASDASPFNGVTYYRLKQTDFDGKFAYSKTEAVHTKGTSTSMFVYAPDSRHIQISYTLTTTQKGMLTVLDSKGVKIWSTPVSGNPGGAIQTINLPVKASGWYLVSLQLDAQVITRKLIVP